MQAQPLDCTGCGDARGATNQPGASAGSSAPSSTGTSGARRANRGISAARKTWSASGFGEAQPSQICPQRPHPLLRRDSERVFSSGQEGVATPQQVSPPPLLLGLQISLDSAPGLDHSARGVTGILSGITGLQAFSAGGGGRTELSRAGRGRLTGVWWASQRSSLSAPPYKMERPGQEWSEPV